jgi:hypothetical protein
MSIVLSCEIQWIIGVEEEIHGQIKSIIKQNNK